MQPGLGALGDVGPADQGLEQAQPDGGVDLDVLGVLDGIYRRGRIGTIGADWRDAAVAVRIASLTLSFASDADGHQRGGGRPGRSRAEP